MKKGEYYGKYILQHKTKIIDPFEEYDVYIFYFPIRSKSTGKIINGFEVYNEGLGSTEYIRYTKLDKDNQKLFRSDIQEYLSQKK